MHKKHFLTLIIGIFSFLAFGFVSAQFQNPGESAPGGFNYGTPIHSGTFPQVKDGNLGVNGFTVEQGAQFDQGVFLEGPVLGANTSNSKVAIGNTTPLKQVAATVNGLFDVRGSLASQDLENTEYRRLCADYEGRIQFCALPQAINEPPPPTPPTQVNFECANTRVDTGPDGFKQGNGVLNFYVASPATQAVTFQAALCMDWPDPYKDTCQGSTTIIPSIPSGFSTSSSTTGNLQFTIPAGASFYTTPVPWLFLDKPSTDLACAENRNGITRGAHLYLKAVGGTGGLNTSFVGRSQGIISMPVTVVP